MSNISVPERLESGQVEGGCLLDIRDIQREMRNGHFRGPMKVAEIGRQRLWRMCNGEKEGYMGKKSWSCATENENICRKPETEFLASVSTRCSLGRRKRRSALRLTLGG